MTQYTALINNILQRLRFAKFSAIVNADLGEQCEYLLEGLLQHGRLTFDQLAVRVTLKHPGAIRNDIRKNFNRLIHANYVERCPFSEPSIKPEDVPSSGKKRSKTDVGSSSVEQQVTIAAAVSHAERFCEIPDMGTNTIPDVKVTDHSPGVPVGDKRKRKAIEVDNDGQGTIAESEFPWRANFEKFVYCLKKKACVEHIKSRSGPNAGIVLEAMIETNHEQKAKDNNSVMSSMDDILEGVKVKPGGSSMTLENVRRILVEELGCRLSDEEKEALHTINLKTIIETCQNDEVEALVVKRYGDEARRIFTLLAKKSIYENDQIHNAALLEKTKTEGILYKFWKDDYLDLKRAISSEDGRQKHNFLWKMNKSVISEHILNDMYHAAINLSQRATHMFEEDPEFFAPYQNLPEAQRKLKIAQQRRWIALLSSLLKIDNGLMLFLDF